MTNYIKHFVSLFTPQKDKAREYLQKFVGSSSKTTDPNYVKAANDKLYALSGP